MSSLGRCLQGIGLFIHRGRSRAEKCKIFFVRWSDCCHPIRTRSDKGISCLVWDWCLVRQRPKYRHQISGRRAPCRAAVECWCRGYTASCSRLGGSLLSGSYSHHTVRSRQISWSDLMAERTDYQIAILSSVCISH